MPLYKYLHNLFSVSKTLRFELQPIGKTKDYFEKSILKQDEERAETFKKVKNYCDEYHKYFIEECLKDFNNSDFTQLLKDYLNFYNNNSKTEKEDEEFEDINKNLRKIISLKFKKNKNYKDLFGKEIIKNYLKCYYKEDNEILKEVALFDDFTTYFTGYNTNRKNMYSDEAKHTAIAYRLIDENLPIYLKNIKAFETILRGYPEIKESIRTNLELDTDKYFTNIENYLLTLSQKQIEEYNLVISGKSTEQGKIQGINELVNLYNQENKTRLPKLKELYKQILSDTDSASFKLDLIQSDKEIVDEINNYYKQFKEKIVEKSELKECFSNLHKYNLEQIYINNDLSLTTLSKNIYGDWAYVKELMEKEWEENYTGKAKRGTEKYNEIKDKDLKRIKEISITKIEELIKSYDKENQNVGKIFTYFEPKLLELFNTIEEKYNNCKNILEKEYSDNSNVLLKDKDSIEKIKEFLDSIKSVQELVKLLIPKNKTIETDSSFYNSLNYAVLEEIIPLYNKVRNYLTKKPYSTEKFKLNFDNPVLLDGWPVDREIATSGIILRKNKLYYLGILDKNFKKDFKNLSLPQNENDIFEKMYYLQAADPSKDIQNLMVIDGKTVKKNGRKDKITGENTVLEELKNTYLPEEINNIRTLRSYSKQSDNFNKSDLIKFIDYYKERAIEYWDKFKFILKESNEYKDFGEFTDYINQQAYQIYFKNISSEYIDKLVEEGKLYLFQIYNKDFSEYSKGKPNLHTMYWKAVFDEENLKDVVYKLNGGAEIFYRRKSIDGKITHPKNEPVGNKNLNNPKKQSKFEYDLIKDKRYSLDKFQFHVPLTMNFKAIGENKLNDRVKSEIKKFDDIHIIGIDRGERHLLYISVINFKGEIVEQCSLNRIINEYNGIKHETDYHKLLDEKEDINKKARRSWGTIENIKELKEGYMSQVVYKLVQLMIKYNAIVVLEDLNSGFKNSRKKVEKQVYDKFETKLISKLSYLIDKEITDKHAEGGLLNAYQLTNTEIKNSKQNGVIFYIPAWCTSKIDPITGFVSLFNLKRINKEFIEKFDSIKFNERENYFEFDVDYTKFSDKLYGKRKNWILCTYGDRIRTFRDPKKNNEWSNETVNLTQELKVLFDRYNIDYNNLKEEILEKSNNQFFNAVKEKDGFYGFGMLFKLLVQLRNSVTGSEEDYILSPVKDKTGKFFDSRTCGDKLPQNADANGAYNIARKGLMLVDRIKSSDEKLRIDYAIKNADWLYYVQKSDK